ncbi:MAG: terpene cyclase/mutase family protein, partial [Gemmataceae bacterium]|nr:terpene cyclase/mutase family protein [Gemmataceae bacterium]
MKKACFSMGSVLALLAGVSASPAEEPTPAVQQAIDKGLAWVARTQHRDGHWEANGGQYPSAMTGVAGMALLMEGSTLRDGKYADNIRRAVDWFLERSQRNGLIGNPNNPSESARYMYGHGFGMLFLASVYGEEEDGDRRRRLEEVLTRGVQFTGKAQTDRGGWGYVSSADGGGFDEGSVTITQMQALRAARNAGIVVPKSIIDKATKYLENCTTERGGVIYSLAHGRAVNGGERPALTAAAIACAFSAGEYNSPLAKKWLKFCQSAIPIGQGRIGHDEYTHYYFAQALYILGDEGYGRLFPESRPEERLTWSRYRNIMADQFVRTQHPDGSWAGGYIGPIFTTSVN